MQKCSVSIARPGTLSPSNWPLIETRDHCDSEYIISHRFCLSYLYTQKRFDTQNSFFFLSFEKWPDSGFFPKDVLKFQSCFQLRRKRELVRRKQVLQSRFLHQFKSGFSEYSFGIFIRNIHSEYSFGKRRRPIIFR